jgi:hypothetical protein
MSRSLLALLSVLLLCGPGAAGDPPWNRAVRSSPPTAEETKAFLKQLLRYIDENHLKKTADSPQRGMVYEYFDTTRKGKPDQWVQGEALDTMHDGAWLAAALVSAYRATGDEEYKSFLRSYSLPFYCKMLNESDKLFSTRRDDSRPGAPRFDREHALQEGEKGFVPYFWDDGASVSLERRRDRNPLGPFPCTDHRAGKPNPEYRLDGYSHGSSNHLAQDLGVMLELAVLLLRDTTDKRDLPIIDPVFQAARHLHECRMRHHGHIPMCDAPAALAMKDAKLLAHLPDQSGAGVWNPDNHTWRALYVFKPGQRYAFPGFADDQQYRYYAGIARHGGQVPDALVFRVVYDALTEPFLYRIYCDDELVPPGINRFDLHPYYCRDGKPEDYRSDRKGPGKGARPVGSRMGPQNMVCCGWALQLLRDRPGLWEQRPKRDFGKDVRVWIDDPVPGRRAEPLPSTTVKVGEVSLRLVSQRMALVLEGECKGDTVVEVFGKPDATGSHARLIVSAKEEIRLVNDRGDPLKGTVAVRAGGPGVRFRVTLPYTFVKGQGVWANAVEHGRYSVRVGKEVRNFYLLSPETRVREHLAYELGQGLRTWQAVFRELGYIPTGLGTGGEWERYSDSGGYAHLIAAGAQWLLVLAEKKDWEQHGVPVLLPGKK